MSDSYNVVYSPQALNDLKDIYAYIAQELLVPDTARNQVNRIRKEIRSLDFMPSRYALVDWEPWKSMGMHKVPVDNFVVFYTVDSDSMTVTVIRIVYGGRDIESIAAQNHEWRPFVRAKLKLLQRTTIPDAWIWKPLRQRCAKQLKCMTVW